MFNEEYFAKIKTKQDFIAFLEMLEKDYSINYHEWSNTSIADYLESIRAWIIDSTLSQDRCLDYNSPNWGLIALVFYMGKIYE